MSKNNWTLLKRGVPVDLKLFEARFDNYLNERNGKESKMVSISGADSVNVVAIDPQGNIVLVRQFRFGIEADTIELPGGLVDSGEDILHAAKRELREETGYTGGEWQFLHTVQSNPVFMNSSNHHFLAIGVTQTQELQLDDGEAIDVVVLTPEAVRNAYESGLIRHPLTLTGLIKVFDLWDKVSWQKLHV